MAVQVRVADRRDRGSAVSALVAAFWTYSETVHLLGDERRRRRVLPRFLAAECADAGRSDGLIIAARDDRVIGACVWLPPGTYPLSAVRQLRTLPPLIPALPWGMAAAAEARRGGEQHRHHHPHTPHCWVRTLGVRPDDQRTGVGQALLAPVLARADAEGAGCYLTTTDPDNVPYYERLAFTVLATYHPTPTWPQVWAMWRDPNDPDHVPLDGGADS
jgi:GNAT superfamily N-acetyltransferase